MLRTLARRLRPAPDATALSSFLVNIRIILLGEWFKDGNLDIEAPRRADPDQILGVNGVHGFV